MGKTIIESIFSTHSKNEVKPGNIVWIDLDIRSARDFGGANVVQNLHKYYPEEQKVGDPKKTFFTFDCYPQAPSVKDAINQQICRDFAQELGIKVYDMDSGIGTHVMIEQGLAIPNRTIVGTDSHLNLLGAVGAFGQGMGDKDIAFAFKSGKTWFEVPETMKITFKGKLPKQCTAKDLTLAVLRKIGSKGALGRAMEFYGEAIDQLDLAGRITLSSMVTEMGGIIGFCPPNQKVINFCQKRSGNVDIQPLYADTDASYTQTVEIDITNLKPLIACPPNPAIVHEIEEIAKKDITVGSVFIGSCTNGRYEDIKMAAEILRGHKVADGVRMKIVPATREVYGKMLKNGLVELFFEAGAMVQSPGCGGCAQGQVGMTGEGEVQISTGNRNFPGKQGAGQTYLASPVTAAACAVAGKITVANL
ncbi:MAG: aconitase/3-isopropylmalate dehydratase large subunit family protein [Candidatus Hodarchaeota archaeon]